MYLAFNHNDTLLGSNEDEIALFRECQQYHFQTGNSFYIVNEDNLSPLCPKCGAVLSQAEYHLSSPDHYGACLDCDEDFYLTEIREFKERDHA